MAKNTGVFTISGHRPKKLFGRNGYDLLDPRWTAIRKAIRSVLEKNHAEELWTGMALGTDMIAALAVIDMQDDGLDIQLNAAVPFKGHNDPRWPEKTRMLYDAILYRSSRVELVTDGTFSTWALEKRNRYMVDHSGCLIAVYNGAPGGTANCIKYARTRHMPIWYIDPSNPEKPILAPGV